MASGCLTSCCSANRPSSLNATAGRRALCAHVPPCLFSFFFLFTGQMVKDGKNEPATELHSPAAEGTLFTYGTIHHVLLMTFIT